MKPCSHNRKRIAWLALGALDSLQERALRTHLESCAGCRGYLEEISNVTEKLAATATPSDLEASESFHRKVVNALRAEEARSENWVAQLRLALSSWRVALPAAGAIVMILAAASVFRQPPHVPLPPPITVQVPAPNGTADLNPTLSNYQMVANRSLEQLDELLNQQGNRNPAPTPVYTASALARASALD